jgi:hypothetical protein
MTRRNFIVGLLGAAGAVALAVRSKRPPPKRPPRLACPRTDLPRHCAWVGGGDPSNFHDVRNWIIGVPRHGDHIIINSGSPPCVAPHDLVLASVTINEPGRITFRPEAPTALAGLTLHSDSPAAFEPTWEHPPTTLLRGYGHGKIPV